MRVSPAKDGRLFRDDAAWRLLPHVRGLFFKLIGLPMSTRVAIQEGARAVPVGAGWAAIMSSDPSTQVGVVAGVLTCIYLLAQMWLILRRARIERRKLEMLEREHSNARDKHRAEMQRLLNERDSGGGP